MSSVPENEDSKLHKATTDRPSNSEANHHLDGLVQPSVSSNARAPSLSSDSQQAPARGSAVEAPLALSDAVRRFGEEPSLTRLSEATLSAVYPHVSRGGSLPVSNMNGLLREAVNAGMIPSVELQRYPYGTTNVPPNFSSVTGLSNPLLSGHSQMFSDPIFTLPIPSNIAEIQRMSAAATGQQQIDNLHAFVLPSRNNLTDPNLLRELSLQSHLFRQRQLLYGRALNSSQLLNPPALPYSYQRVAPNHALALPSSAFESPWTAVSAGVPSLAAPSSGSNVDSSRIGTDTPAQQATNQGLRRNKRKYTHESFPSRLHRLLREANERGHDHICRFTSDGTKFQILHTKSFEDQVLPRYFRHGSIDSFKRLLRMYSWQRVEGTWMQGTFEHPMFRRDAPELCLHMERKEKK